MSEPKEVQLNHGQIEGLYLEGWTTFIEKSAYQAEKEAKESYLDLIKKIHGVASSIENYDGDSFKMFNMAYIADLSAEFLKQLEAGK